MSNRYNTGSNSTSGTANTVKILSKQKSGFKICHINAQSLRNKIDEMRFIFENSGVDAVCVSETWFDANVTDVSISLCGYKVYRVDRKGHAGGVAIYVKQGINCHIRTKSNENSLMEYILLEVIGETGKLLIGCVYRPNNYTCMDSLIDVLDSLSALYNDVVISGDFNSNIINDPRLPSTMQSIGLWPVNTTLPTHFTGTSETLLDLFFVGCKNSVLLYDQLTASCFSKHDLIFLTYDYTINISTQSFSFRDFKNIDYNMLNDEYMKIDWNCIYNMVSTDDKLSYLAHNVNNLFNLVVPLKTKLIYKNNRPWFSQNIKEAIRQRDLAYNRWKRHRTSILHELFRNARKNAHKMIKKAKSAFYASKFANAIGVKKTWRTIREIGIGKANITASCVTDADEINNKFVNIPLIESCPSYYNFNDNISEDQNSFSFMCINELDVISNCLSVKSNSVGSDEIHPKFLKILLPQLLPIITHIFNRIITTSNYPNRWKIAKIIPIPKPNSEYRPIAILPFLSKVFERILRNQMNDFLLSNNLLTDRQSGFREKNSCITALVDVAEDIRKMIDDKNIALLILLDHSKAFDTVDHKMLCNKLRHFFRFSITSSRLISTYLNNRYQYVEINGKKSQSMLVTRGVPQGSILGPLMFTLYSNDLPLAINHCNIRMYADDVQIYMECKPNFISQYTQLINQDLNNVYLWASANGLTINPKKSKCLVIQKRTSRISQDIAIFLNSQPIEIVNHAKNLGVIFNSSLTWSNHIDSVCGRAYAMLRTLWQTQYCTPIKIRILLSKTYLIPILLYGCELFANCDAKSKAKLNRTFNNIVRYVFGLHKYDRISLFTNRLYNISFNDLLKLRVLIFLHKIIYTHLPDHLYKRLRFSRFSRGKRLILFRHNCLISEWQFFINATRNWNLLPHTIQTICNAAHFKKNVVSLLATN